MISDKSVATQANTEGTPTGLPDGWEIKTLRDIAEIDTENLPNSTPPNFTFNYISLEQVDMGQLIGYTETEFRMAPSRARRVVRYDDVLMSTVRPNLMAHLHYRGQVPNAVCSTGFAVIRTKREVSDPGFIFAHLFGKVVNKQVEQILVGSNYPAITSGDVGSIRIPCPSDVREQRAIAAVLSDIDGMLDALDALIAKKQDIKKATMQQLLTGKTRLPGFSGEWETKRLGDMVSIRNQRVLPSNVDADTLCVELDHIGQDNGQLLVRSTSQDSSSMKCRFFAGDVLFGRLRSYLRKFWHADDNGICTTEIWPLMTDVKQMDDGFLYAIVQSDQFLELSGVSYGTHMPRADWDVLQELDIILPDLPEQRAIAAVLSDMDAEIAALRERRDKTSALKQGMMQELLTGRIRLPATE